MTVKLIKLFLRLALSASFLSAVADRFGWWGDQSVWGNWENFVQYTQLINPWFPASFVEPLAVVATAAEIVFALTLLVGYRTELFATQSGFLLLAFALSLTFAVGLKGALDYSVLSASAAAFALSQMKEKFLEIDSLLKAK